MSTTVPEAKEAKSLTQKIMESLPSETQAMGAGGASTYEGLLRADAGWTALRNMKTGEAAGSPPEFVKEVVEPLGEAPAFDVVVCGGTLGIFTATAMQMRGFKVAVVERGPLQGRQQEWNISEDELMEVVAAGALGEQDALDAVGIHFNPMRAGFKRREGDEKGVDTFCTDVLNMGVKPSVLVERARRRFEEAGGVVMEFTGIDGMTVHPDGVALSTAGGGSPLPSSSSSSTPAKGPDLTARLVLDCMGNFSPVVRQIRWGLKPEGVCLVVGSCARGFDPEENTSGDIIYANSPVQPSPGAEGGGMQYFWEAFPAGSGPKDRTTYMFSYMDADPRRTSLQDMMEDYWRLLPQYQGVELEQLSFLRVLFGFFPTYKRSPLPASFNRICQIGDASGMQSPLSFGGFACLTRHIERITGALTEALEEDLLDKGSLGLVNAYQPSLTATWMFQKSMSVGVGEKVDENLIVDLLANNFRAMDELGLPVLKPFLQDVVQFSPLSRILLGVMLADPLSIPPLLLHVGALPILDWTVHFALMGVYSALHGLASPPLRALGSWSGGPLGPGDRFRVRRLAEAWQFGSGLDYVYRPPQDS